MLALAAGFGNDAALPEPPPFIGSRRCSECHLRIYREQQLGSPHASTIYLERGPEGCPAARRSRCPTRWTLASATRFSRLSDDRIELETRRGDQVARAVIEYALGSGRAWHHDGRQVDEPLGIDRELRISYYSADRSWRETKGIKTAPHDPSDFIGLSLNDQVLAPVSPLPHDLVPRGRAEPLSTGEAPNHWTTPSAASGVTARG